MNSQLEVCGPSSTQACGDINLNTDLATYEGTYRDSYRDDPALLADELSDRLRNGTPSGDPNETVVVTGLPDGVRVVGRTFGIGDPRCRRTTPRSVSVDASLLTVEIANTVDPPEDEGCYETLAPNFYRLTVTDVEPMPTRVRVRHTHQQYDRTEERRIQETAFETAVDVAEPHSD